jgi:hypothetical protein
LIERIELQSQNGSRDILRVTQELHTSPGISSAGFTDEEIFMKYALVIATVAALATPALAEEVGVGVGVGPVGAGVTVGEGHRDYDRDRDRDRTTVIKEREPTDRTTVIKKERGDGVERRTIIHDHD